MSNMATKMLPTIVTPVLNDGTKIVMTAIKLMATHASATRPGISQASLAQCRPGTIPPRSMD